MADNKEVRSAQAPGRMGKTPKTTGGGHVPKVDSDGLKRAWMDQTSKPSTLINMDHAKKKVK